MPVQKTMVAAGNGVTKPQAGDTVRMSYSAYIMDSAGQRGAKFDTTDERGDYSVVIGMGKVIKGWDEAVLRCEGGMTLGEYSSFSIPSELAYGKNGFRNRIPPNATLIFDIKLQNIRRA